MSLVELQAEAMSLHRLLAAFRAHLSGSCDPETCPVCDETGTGIDNDENVET